MPKPAQLPSPPPAGKTVQVSVNAAPAFDEPSSSRQSDSPLPNGMADHHRQPHAFARSAIHAMEESGDNSEGLQQSLDGDAVQAKPSTAAREEQPVSDSSPLHAAVRRAEFGADFLAVPSSP